MHRMENTADHTDLHDLAQVIGADYIPLPNSPRLSETKDEERRRASLAAPSMVSPNVETRRASEAVGSSIRA